MSWEFLIGKQLGQTQVHQLEPGRGVRVNGDAGTVIRHRTPTETNVLLNKTFRGPMTGIKIQTPVTLTDVNPPIEGAPIVRTRGWFH